MHSPPPTITRPAHLAGLLSLPERTPDGLVLLCWANGLPLCMRCLERAAHGLRSAQQSRTVHRLMPLRWEYSRDTAAMTCATCRGCFPVATVSPSPLRMVDLRLPITTSHGLAHALHTAMIQQPTRQTLCPLAEQLGHTVSPWLVRDFGRPGLLHSLLSDYDTFTIPPHLLPVLLRYVRTRPLGHGDHRLLRLAYLQASLSIADTPLTGLQ